MNPQRPAITPAGQSMGVSMPGLRRFLAACDPAVAKLYGDGRAPIHKA
jgi:hypothetical protein